MSEWAAETQATIRAKREEREQILRRFQGHPDGKGVVAMLEREIASLRSNEQWYERMRPTVVALRRKRGL